MANVVQESVLQESRFAADYQPVAHDGQPDDFALGQLPESLDSAVTDNLPISELPRVLSAALCPQFVSDYYERIHVTPPSIDLGNLLSNQVRFFDVWNAYVVPQTLDTINITGDPSGAVLTEPGVPPLAYGALESKQYSIEFDTTGPGEVDIEYEFDFGLGQLATLVVSGKRIIIFAFPPDWSDPVLERLEWLTQVIEADDGTENRHRLRTNPRRSLEYSVLVADFDKRWLETYMWAWKSNVFSVPIWTDCARTTTVTAINDTVINVVTDDFSFVVGGIAIFVLSQQVTEAVEILSMTSTTLTLVRPILANWIVGSRIYPALSGRMMENVELVHPTADITLASLRFEFINNAAIPAVDSAVAYQNGFVLEKKPNRAEDLGLEYESKYGLVDFGIAPPMVDDRSGFPDIVTSLTFAENDRSEIWGWREWLHSRAGRWDRFYMPSQSLDFIPKALIADSANAIMVEDFEYRNFVNLAPGKRDIAIFTVNDGVFYRRLTSAAKGAPGEEILGIDSPLGMTIPLEDIFQISYLHPVRLDGDSVEIAWDHTQMARVAFNTRVLAE